MAENESGKRIKVFRTDRGGEFISKDFVEYCENAGIKRHLTAPYSPQQNGVVERRNRTVVAMARSILKAMKVPSEFWGEAARHSVYLLNRLPTRALTGMTPYEAWKNKKPDVRHLRVFGCVAHMKIPSVHTTKLNDRSKMVVHLGREVGTKAYRLYDPITGSIHVSRDVVFEEKRAWTWEEQQQQDKVTQESFSVLGSHLSESNAHSNEEEPTTPGNETVMTSSSETGESSTHSRSTSSSSEPKKFRLLSEIYDETEEVETENELLLLGTDEPNNYREAAAEQAWERAMENEIDAIERNNT